MSPFEFDFQDIVNTVSDVVIVTKKAPISSPNAEIVYVNKAFTTLTGYSFNEATGGNPRVLDSLGTDSNIQCHVRQALDEQEPVRAVIKNRSKSGKRYCLDMRIFALRGTQGDGTYFAAMAQHVIENRVLEFQLGQLSSRDPLSGLLNRYTFDRAVELELSRFFKTAKVFSVLVVDIDHLKAVNNAHGHRVGDRVIKKIAETCVLQFGEIGQVARTGGEEFTILVPGMGAQYVEPLAERLCQKVAGLVVNTDVGSILPTTSIGISEVGCHDKITSQILSRANKALDEAKQAGMNRVCVDKVVSC